MIKVGRTRAYNVQEAAKLLDVSAQTIRKYIKNGELSAVKTGTKYQITEKNLENYLKGEKVS